MRLAWAVAAMAGASLALLGAVALLATYAGAGLDDTASAVTIVLFVASPSAYAVRVLWNRNEEKKRALGIAYRELGNAWDGLDREKYASSVVRFVTRGGEDAYFMRRKLNHDLYDSLVFTGKLALISRWLQQLVQDAYSLIKMHNDGVIQLQRLSYETKQELPEEALPICESLRDIEEELRVLIPKILGRLEADAGGASLRNPD